MDGLGCQFLGERFKIVLKARVQPNIDRMDFKRIVESGNGGVKPFQDDFDFVFGRLDRGVENLPVVVESGKGFNFLFVGFGWWRFFPHRLILRKIFKETVKLSTYLKTRISF